MITTGIAKFILVVVFINGGNSYTSFANLGEFSTMANCQGAASAILKAHIKVSLRKEGLPSFVCAAKGNE